MPLSAGRSVATRFVVAAALAALALCARLVIDDAVGDRIPFLLCCLAVVAAAWNGGLGPALLALAIGLPGVAYLFLQPRYDLTASVPANHVQLFGMTILSLTIGLFSERMRAARRRAEEHARDAVRRHEELELEVFRREKLELQLQQRAADLAEADRLKDEFLAMLGHELRNPLAPIRTSAETIRYLAADAELRSAAERIERQSAHLGRLVDDLLDVSRITRGKVTLEKQPLDLACVVTRAVEATRPLIDGRKHELTVTLPPTPVWVDGDATRLSQVLSNLLSNAAKYTPAGGQVRLSVEAAAASGEAIIRVSDDGVGVPAGLLLRIFDLFVQGDRGLARSEGGLGIGLTLVRSLVQLHGGMVEAHSEGPGKGSEFVVRLPYCSPPVESFAEAAPPVRPSGRRRILAVDDNVDAVESLALVLGLHGHEVRTAYDGPAALEEAEAFQPEVVILDVGLPGMDGHEVARRLRRREGSDGVLIVALTGYGRESDRRRSLEAGCDRHLVKPVDPATLRDLLAMGCQAGKDGKG